MLSRMEIPEKQLRKPAPELESLDYFAGTWSLEGEMRASAMGAGGITETDRNQWMEGGFFLIVRSEFATPEGSGSGVAYMGYDPSEKVYTYDEFNSVGDAIHSKGTVIGGTWTWSGERKTEDGVTKTRWVVTILSPHSYNFRFETLQDGTNWNLVMSGKATRQK
jgi:hypothetical protein